MKITRRQLREMISEAARDSELPEYIPYDHSKRQRNPPDVNLVGNRNSPQSLLAQRMAIHDNFQDEEYYSRDYLINKLIEAELDQGFGGILDFVLGTDV